MKHYAITYHHNGKRLSLYLCADSFEDACEQVVSARHDGEVFEVVDAIHLAGFSRRLDVLGWALFLAAMGVIFWR